MNIIKKPGKFILNFLAIFIFILVSQTGNAQQFLSKTDAEKKLTDEITYLNGFVSNGISTADLEINVAKAMVSYYSAIFNQITTGYDVKKSIDNNLPILTERVDRDEPTLFTPLNSVETNKVRENAIKLLSK